MYIDSFFWLRDILEKLEVKHHVNQDEVEQVLFNKPRFFFIEQGNTPNEDVYSASGQTDAGRYLIVFFIRKPNYIALILSARDMNQKERKRYGRK